MRIFTRALGTAALMALVAVGPAHAQDESADAAKNAAHLPADSMEIGDRYIDWFLDFQADSIWAHFDDGMKERMVSVADFMDQLYSIFERAGYEERTISQRYWMRNGKPQFWHTAKFSNIDEPLVMRLVIEPDGRISGLGLNPESQNPRVDDPDQHADDGS